MMPQTPRKMQPLMLAGPDARVCRRLGGERWVESAGWRTLGGERRVESEEKARAQARLQGFFQETRNLIGPYATVAGSKTRALGRRGAVRSINFQEIASGVPLGRLHHRPYCSSLEVSLRRAHENTCPVREKEGNPGIGVGTQRVIQPLCAHSPAAYRSRQSPSARTSWSARRCRWPPP